MLIEKIGQVHEQLEGNSKELEYYQKSLQVLERLLHSKQTDLATTHDNIGQMYMNMGNYEKALISHRNAIDIEQKATLNNHSQLRLFKEHLAELVKKDIEL